MANWSETTKHEPISINSGNRYEQKDRLSRESLNALVENSFYAMKKSDESKSESSNAINKANEALSKVTQSLGTSININGVLQTQVNFTSDPQTQIDDLKENDVNKANKDLSNVTYPTNTIGNTTNGAGDRVIETYISSDGKTWYRKWASGWKECGIYGTVSTWTQGTVTLPLEFTNSNYTCLATMQTESTSTGLSSNQMGIVSKTTNSISIYASKTSPKIIYCCGY